jgi:hypothetical protein
MGKYLVDLSGLNAPVVLHSGYGDAEQIRLVVLPGDVNRNGSVGLTDVVAVRDHAFTFASDGPFDPAYDIDGNGIVDLADRQFVQRNSFRRAPTSEISGTLSLHPVAPVPAPAAEAVVARVLGASRTIAAPITRESAIVQRPVLSATPNRSAVDRALASWPSDQSAANDSTPSSRTVLRARRGTTPSASTPSLAPDHGPTGPY